MAVGSVIAIGNIINLENVTQYFIYFVINTRTKEQTTLTVPLMKLKSCQIHISFMSPKLHKLLPSLIKQKTKTSAFINSVDWVT